MIFLDTETCGFTGPIVLIQYAHDDGSVHLHEVWKVPVQETLKLIEEICNADSVCCFNLSFDWFHINKLYNLLSMVQVKSKPPNIDEVVAIQKSMKGIFRYCLKPKTSLDLMLVARKSEWQSLLGRKEVRIRKVPSEIAYDLAQELRKRIDLPPIYFVKRATGYQWEVEIIKDQPSLADLVCRFAPSSSLKALATQIFGHKCYEFPVPESRQPNEQSYNPYTTDWQHVIQWHIDLWHNNSNARGYAQDDIIILQRLYHHFAEPQPGDDDSELASCVGAVRWKGYSIDYDKIHGIFKSNQSIIDSMPINFDSYQQVINYLLEVCPSEIKYLIVNSAKETLTLLTKYDDELGQRAKKVLAARSAAKENDNLKKLIEAGRFCPDFKIIGTRSGRMSGGDDEQSNKKLASINPQGIQHAAEYRSIFTFRDDGYILSGGDFAGFEVTICDAVYKDPQLHTDLETGKKFHTLLGMALFDEDYETVSNNKELYAKAKSSAFALIYGAMPEKLATTAGIDSDDGERAYRDFIAKYPKIGVAREVIFNAFCSIRQPNGIGTPVEWHEPAEYIESLLGFRRYFTIENKIVRAIFELACSLPLSFKRDGKVIRNKKRGREQTIAGATQSALFGIAFQMQARNMRAAGNHVIQSTGAEICKNLQRKIWDRQPSGIHHWIVQPMNIHDEIMVVHTPDETRNIVWLVQEMIEKYRKIIPLIKMEWKPDFNNWGEK